MRHHHQGCPYLILKPASDGSRNYEDIIEIRSFEVRIIETVQRFLKEYFTKFLR
jgi:hypothetical protein